MLIVRNIIITWQTNVSTLVHVKNKEQRGESRIPSILFIRKVLIKTIVPAMRKDEKDELN